jgi:uncharacterized protein YcfL
MTRLLSLLAAMLLCGCGSPKEPWTNEDLRQQIFVNWCVTLLWIFISTIVILDAIRHKKK